jgi:hypothetical protein
MSSSFAIAVLTLSFSTQAKPALPKWLGHEVMVGGTADAPVLYGIGRQTAARFCDSRFASQALNIAGTRARTAIAELLGLTEARVVDEARVGDTELRSRTDYRNNRGDAETTTTRTSIQSEQIASTTSRSTGQGVVGVRVLRAWYDVETRTIYVLAAKPVHPTDIDGLGLVALSELEGMSPRQAELTMREHCGQQL